MRMGVSSGVLPERSVVDSVFRGLLQGLVLCLPFNFPVSKTVLFRGTFNSRHVEKIETHLRMKLQSRRQQPITSTGSRGKSRHLRRDGNRSDAGYGSRSSSSHELASFTMNMMNIEPFYGVPQRETGLYWR